MKKRVVLVRHGHDPDDDRIFTHLLRRGYDPDVRKPFAGDGLGDVTPDLAGTVIYGGIYNAYDEDLYPFLNEEYRWIGAILAAGLPLIGICQGAQMLARHRGAWAGAREGGLHEFGYYEITPTEAGRDFMPGPLVMAEQHFHTFDLPEGAVRLASSAAYENQAFRLGDNAYGLQFHAEQTVDGFRRWQTDRADAYGKPGVQSREEQDRLMQRHDAAQEDWFFGFLERVFPAVAA